MLVAGHHLHEPGQEWERAGVGRWAEGGGEGGRVEGWEWSCQVAANAEKSTGALCVYINMMKLYLPIR